jgi:uncharacterized membrane protein YozB (DUF420 family)
MEKLLLFTFLTILNLFLAVYHSKNNNHKTSMLNAFSAGLAFTVVIYILSKSSIIINQ